MVRTGRAGKRGDMRLHERKCGKMEKWTDEIKALILDAISELLLLIPKANKVEGFLSEVL